MAAQIKEVKPLKLSDLVIGKGQVRVKDVGKDLDELADSIRTIGLLEPIVVSPPDKSGKYQILTGQRRFLAHRQLKKATIMAAILSEAVDESVAKAISVTENLVRSELSQRELIDACTSLYKKYGSVNAVCEETGLPNSKVKHYVKYDRLLPQLKKMVDQGDVDIKVALRAQDAASVTGKPNEKEAVMLAKEMGAMSGVQQQRIVKDRIEKPDTPVDEVIESAKTGAKVTQVIVTLSADVHSSLQKFAQSEGQAQDDAAATLIEESLEQKGF
jgi:ParB family chromosome partitioning protein